MSLGRFLAEILKVSFEVEFLGEFLRGAQGGFLKRILKVFRGEFLMGVPKGSFREVLTEILKGRLGETPKEES